ncbi:carbohydrate kinase [Endozoicomonas sp. SM1973]|uniref:Carbohydrate kinase n=1 Tax=Spartinivicinus marinus TaxID=2994442 RepID=A0A853I5B3_9GAMM|nr:carbohydrate kinase [Spartinivicinus marinus]MCX4029979.1 carbohydrate kinase [Spartinivicinus marinus]NYZ64777.1 carbohydrate kinase [Spartinivicinus marinus]
MSIVYSFGELLVDMLAQPDSQQSVNYRPFPGGAPANVAVAVAKLGGESRFVGQVGDDFFGHWLVEAVKQYDVNSDYLFVTSQAKTALAFVSLDAQGERCFSFYRDQSADLCFDQACLDRVDFAAAAIFHCCSNTLTHGALAEVTQEALQRARQQGAITSFDINLRPALWPEDRSPQAVITDCIKQVDIIKASVEELAQLKPDWSLSQWQDLFINNGTQLIVLTDGARPVQVVTPDGQFEQAAPIVKVVDTTAAGDAFVGGLLFGLANGLKQGLAFTDWLASGALQETVAQAVVCGALTVSRAGAFPALPYRHEVDEFLLRGQGGE